jgi:lipoyl(octanoyl) transferase
MAIEVVDFGLMKYAEAFALQRQRHAGVAEGSAEQAVFVVEHPAVVTVSQRKESEGHLVVSREELGRRGIDVQQTNRGGDITYHGPGQVVIYPIIRMAEYGLNLSSYMHLLEAVVQRYLLSLGIPSHCDPKAIGVWVKTPDGKDAKVCALGVRIARNVTQHGLALNVSTDMAHFETIVPCGLAGREVTRLVDLLGERCPGIDVVKRDLARALVEELEGRRVSVVKNQA